MPHLHRSLCDLGRSLRLSEPQFTHLSMGLMVGQAQGLPPSTSCHHHYSCTFVQQVCAPHPPSHTVKLSSTRTGQTDTPLRSWVVQQDRQGICVVFLAKMFTLVPL